MTSSHGYWTYQDLIQTYDLSDIRRVPPKNPTYSSDTIMGYVNHDEFKIFKFLVKTAQMDEKMDQYSFNSTLFICKDEDLLKNYPEEFFMKLDRNSARTLLNYHILVRQIDLKSLLGSRASKIDTKNPRSEIEVSCKNGTVLLNNQAYVIKEVSRSNGIIFIIDNLLIPPEGFDQNCC
jgi:uncharacterized surface protein with fasciclin (FAS1) repeats